MSDSKQVSLPVVAEAVPNGRGVSFVNVAIPFHYGLLTDHATAMAEIAKRDAYIDQIAAACGCKACPEKILEGIATLKQQISQHFNQAMENGAEANSLRTKLEEAQQAISQARAEAFEEAAELVEDINAPAGDRATYENRSMNCCELSNMHSLSHAAAAIRSKIEG